MGRTVFYCGGSTGACVAAKKRLMQQGLEFSESPGPEVTDLLLDIPSLRSDGKLRSGLYKETVLQQLPDRIRIWGGKLKDFGEQYQLQDLLEDPVYLSGNAAITADCALRLTGPRLNTTWEDCRVLIIGWGRIGKNLCRMLRALGAQVTVCARKPRDRALLSSCHFPVLKPEDLDGRGFDVIFNTAPAAVMEESQLGDCPLPVDLASQPGLLGRTVIRANGLPGKYAPVSSGKLIADTILYALGR